MICIVNMRGLFFRKTKSITINNGSQKSLDDSNTKPNKIWVDKASEMKSWLQYH